MRAWSKKRWAIFGAGIIILIIIIVVAAVEGSKKNAYPDYSQLNYTLKDTCKLSSFVQYYIANNFESINTSKISEKQGFPIISKGS